MSEWKNVKLKDCCHSISDGDHLPPPKSDSGVPFVTIANIDATNHIDFGNTMFVPLEYYNNLNDIRKAKCNDILYSVVGSFGKPVLIKENKPFAFQRHIAILRPNNEIADSRFLYYVLLSHDFYMQADSVAIGAAQRTISLTALRNMKVELPPIETQHRIASILSRYDSLIENYQKQIKLLEEAAQRLYKEWFIDLHFPGHENTNIVDGVPEGWEKKKVGEIVKTTSGGTPSRSKQEYYTGDILWAKTKELCDGFIFNTEEKITKEAIKSSSVKLIPEGSILMAMYGATIGKLGVATKELSCNQACCVFLFDENNNTIKWFIYNWLLRNREFLVSQGKGAAQPNLSQDMIKRFELLIPCDKTISSYNDNVNGLYCSIKSLQSQLRLLTEARDRLLPKLMSGAIEV